MHGKKCHVLLTSKKIGDCCKASKTHTNKANPNHLCHQHIVSHQEDSGFPPLSGQRSVRCACVGFLLSSEGTTEESSFSYHQRHTRSFIKVIKYHQAAPNIKDYLNTNKELPYTDQYKIT